MFSKLGSNKATTDRFRTNRERQRSASRLRLKNSKRTSKRHAVSSTVPEKSKRGPNWRTKGDPLGFLKSILLQNIKKNEGEKLWEQ